MNQAQFDFESEKIESRPAYPPKPVGLAISLPGQPHRYCSWGHASGNGIYVLRGKKLIRIEGDAKIVATSLLKQAKKCDSILGHNSSKFDWDVAETHMGVTPPPWHKQDDSLFARFLVDPHAPTLSLKPSAEAVLGEKPEERDAVFDWLYQHGFIQKPKTVNGRLVYQKDAGAYISKAPGDLVSRYAIGDCTRSKGLFDHDMKIIKRDGMMEAYDRERRVAPILLQNERDGMRVDIGRLEKDRAIYRAALLKVEEWLRKKLRAPAGINWDADAEVAAVLRKSGQVKVFPQTATGRESVSKSRLTKEFFRDPDVYLALVYRNTVAYVLTQNIEPWLETATRSGSRIFTIWNQVRSDREAGGGARSGRITCSKVGNIIKDPTGGKNPDYLKADDERIRKLIGLPPLPLARVYVLPDGGGLFVHVDWRQQEVKLTAHYEDAELAKAYCEDPKVDIHKFCTDLINSASGQSYFRDVIKHVNLRQFYGGGREGLVTHPMLRLDKAHGCKLDCRHKEDNCAAYKAAGKIMQDWRRGLPGVVSLTRQLSAMYQRGEPIRTLGGRLYRCKPAGIATKGSRKGQWVTFEYTALNYLVQPSGADMLKMAMIKYHDHPKRRARLLCVVHDEVNVSAPVKIAKQEMALLQEVMESIKLDVPTKTDGDVRPNWGEKQ